MIGLKSGAGPGPLDGSTALCTTPHHFAPDAPARPAKIQVRHGVHDKPTDKDEVPGQVLGGPPHSLWVLIFDWAVNGLDTTVVCRARLASPATLGGAMGTVEVRSLDQPDETRSFANGVVEMVTIGDTMVGRARFAPGWRWSNDVKPIAGTEWCMVLHEGYCVSGSAIVQAEDGSETRIGPGDGYVIEPGHDAWVLGDEPWVTVDFSQAMADYAKPS